MRTLFSWKKAGAAVIASLMAVGMLGACGGGSSNSSGTKITIFNSKVEIESQMEEMAKKYSKEKGVDVEVYYSNDTVAAHLATKYASKDPYTISMVDAKDVYSLAKEHAVDLSDQSWVKDTDYAISIDGKIQELKDGGMTSPTGVMKEDWSLAAHFLPEVYEEQEDPNAFLLDMKAGKVDLHSNAKWTSLMNFFDVMKENNYAKSSAISAEREVTEQKLAEGEIAFMFGGNWDWSVINQYDYSKNMGLMPVPQNMDDGTNEKLVGGGSKYFFIDSSDNTSDAQRKAAKEFLTWLAEDKDGQEFITNEAALVSPFKSNTLEVADPLSKSVKSYADSGKLIPNYNYLPDDHYSVLGAKFQKWLAGEEDRATLAKDIQDYWKTAKFTGESA